MHAKPIQELIEKFASFPTIGRRTAARFVFYLLKAKESEVDALMSAIQELRKRMRLCSFCFNPFDAEDTAEERCQICRDKRRDTKLLCILEKESDLQQIEKTKQYRGLYFILGGTVGMMRKEDREHMRIPELKERVQAVSPEEIILALNSTAEGDTTALYLERALKPFQGKITRLGKGLPTGGELEYADEETLRSALEGRK
ncbi:MAG: recombination mediator RecR [Candidatus Yanofskybacteria bacterium]|nr:recombination mediator RecR [Candidatus Yanofskybacteria bacterium]